MEQDSRVRQKLMLIVVTSVLVVALGYEYRPPTSGRIQRETTPVASTNSEAFIYVTNVSGIPADVSKALAQRFGAPILELAEPGAEYDFGCVTDSKLPRRRLVLAAVRPTFVVIHYEEGGFAPAAYISVIQRPPGGLASVVQHFHADGIYTNPKEFENALHKLLSPKALRYSNPRLGV